MRRRTFLAGAAAIACTTSLPTPTPAPTPAASADRLRDLLAGMSITDRAAQVMSVAFRGPRVTAHVERMIREKHVGGVILFRENAPDADALRRMTAELQRMAREARIPPLFIAMDQEGGPVVRVAGGVALLPSQMALAATPDPHASVRRAAAVTARELRALGVNWQLAPVADVNDEPRNPIIGNRSFGSDPRMVGDLVATAVRAYADAGMLCCAKHFPGHGAATQDSHEELPELALARARLDAVELVPFRAAIAAGVPTIMSAHLVVRSLGTGDLPATLSPRVMTDLLRSELGFAGLSVTDDLEMGALARSGGQAAAGPASLLAGADYLLFRFDESAQLEGHRLIVEAASSGALPPTRLADAVRRVLATKLRWGILDPAPATTFDLDADRAEALDLARQAVTVLRAGGLPLSGRVLAVSFGQPDIAIVEGQPTLAAVVARMHPNTVARELDRLDAAAIAATVGAAAQADAVVVGTYDPLGDPRQAELVTALQRVRPTIAVALRTPYDVSSFPTVGGYVCVYSGREPSLVAAVEVMTGRRAPQGRLPVDIPGLYRIGAGMQTLRAASPFGDAARRVVDDAIGTVCTAASVLVERDGQRDGYVTGSLCPDPAAGADAPATTSSLFDLASLTKLATTALLLSFVKERQLSLDTPLRTIVPDFRGGAKDRVTLSQVLTHTAGLKWWLPLYEEATSLDEAVWRAAQEPLAHDAGTFVYSDLGYIMLTQGLANVGGAPFEQLIRERVLGPVGAETARFRPDDPLVCVATQRYEDQGAYRRRRLRGEVDDDNAAAMGGVSGHAGLFGTAQDVLSLMRVFRDGALIGNELAALTRREHARGENARRGLGLMLRAPAGAMCGRCMTEDAYGHSGFTGTSVWVDPGRGITVVLLTNRVYFGRTDDPIYRLRIAAHEALTCTS